mmetsp:Transcript_290/g.1006  ORF Transcript_290/g.1006 Transcript_290/m.1006 type:complete len:403 (-) Transcript_290:973-2181(-)
MENLRCDLRTTEIRRLLCPTQSNIMFRRLPPQFHTRNNPSKVVAEKYFSQIPQFRIHSLRSYASTQTNSQSDAVNKKNPLSDEPSFSEQNSHQPASSKVKSSVTRSMIKLFLASMLGGALYFAYNYKMHKGDTVYTEFFQRITGTNNLFVSKQLFLLYGMYPFPSNAFAARMANGDVLVYNPVRLTTELRTQIQETMLGPNGVIRVIVANKEHTQFVTSWRDGFESSSQGKTAPKVIIYVRDTNEKLLKTLTQSSANVFTVKNETDFPVEIRKEFDIQFIDGLKMLDEIVLYHRATKMLICCDMAQHITHLTYPPGIKMPIVLRMFFMHLAQSVDHLAAPGEIKFVPHEKDKFRQSIEKMCRWPFSGITMGHGDTIAPIPDMTLNEVLLEDYKLKVFDKKGR